MGVSPLVSLVFVLLQVIFLEGVLSLDNAAVLGAIVQRLPATEPVPWPKFLEPFHRPLNRILGKQRSAALKVGLIGAYAGRALMLVLANFVIHNHWLQLVGALYLIKISVADLGHLGEETHEEERPHRRRDYGFWGTVLTVELMDLAFSLDNVVVVVSLSNDLLIVLLGVALGILTMRFAAGVFSGLIEKFPALGPAAYVLVFNIGFEFLLGDFGIEVHEAVRFGINAGVLIAAVIYSRWQFLQRLLRQPFRLFRWLFFLVDRVFFVVLYPFSWVYKKLAGRRRARRAHLPEGHPASGNQPAHHKPDVPPSADDKPAD